MSGINTGRAAGKSRGRGRSDDVTRSTTDSGGEASSKSQERSGSRASTESSGPSSASGSPPRPSSKPGRPSELQAPKRTTVTLEESHVDFLDNTAARVKLAGGEKLSRGSIMRAVVEAMMEADVDLSSVRDERSLARVILRQLRG